MVVVVYTFNPDTRKLRQVNLFGYPGLQDNKGYTEKLCLKKPNNKKNNINCLP